MKRIKVNSPHGKRKIESTSSLDDLVLVLLKEQQTEYLGTPNQAICNVEYFECGVVNNKHSDWLDVYMSEYSLGIINLGPQKEKPQYHKILSLI